jgi:hypothetical protein
LVVGWLDVKCEFPLRVRRGIRPGLKLHFFAYQAMVSLRHR